MLFRSAGRSRIWRRIQTIDSCYQQSLDCEASESEHIVEYFAADWCEPCQLVEDNLATLNRTDTVILQHHASSEDYTYLNHSKFRYDDKFRLLFIPSLVIDGNGLLTGSSQALDLNQSLNSNIGLQNNSLSDVILTDGIIRWNHSAGQKYKAPVCHPHTAVCCSGMCAPEDVKNHCIA